jgi:methylglutaconyl-CoA hydratase
MGVPAARVVFVTGEAFDAQRALALGLVQRVAPAADDGDAGLDAIIDALAAQIVRGGPTAVAECKRLAMTVMDLPRGERLATTAGVIARLRGSAEGQEGMLSFVQKRPPRWVGGE